MKGILDTPMKTKKLFSLSSFLENLSKSEKTLIEEEMNMTSLKKQPFLLPSSNILHYVYGFKKNGHPYIIHVAQLDMDAANGLWEVKISKLAFGKDLKTYEKLEADIDSKSMNLYEEILETILPEISDKIRSRVKCLIFPFPHQLEFSKLEVFNFKMKKLIQKHFPALTRHNTSHPQAQNVKWAYFSSVMLNKVFDAFLDQTTVDIDKVMSYFLENPEEFKPQKKVIVTNEVDQFPELMNVEKGETDEDIFNDFLKFSAYTKEEIQNKIDKTNVILNLKSFLENNKDIEFTFEQTKSFLLNSIKSEKKSEVESSDLLLKFQHINKFYNLSTVIFDIKDGYNYSANDDTFYKIDDLNLDKIEKKSIFEKKHLFDNIIKKLFPGEEFEAGVAWLLSLFEKEDKTFSSEDTISDLCSTLKSFIKWCFDFIKIIKLDEDFDNFNEYLLPKFESIDNNNDDNSKEEKSTIKSDEENSLILNLLKIQSLFITSDFDANINYLLKKDEFIKLAEQRKIIFATRQIDFDSFKESKGNFDLIIKGLDYSSNWEESLKILLLKNENSFFSKQNQLYVSSLSFVSWIKNYKEYWKTKDFDSSKSIYFNECLPSYEKTFPFSHQFNFFEQYNKENKSEEEETFELFLKEFCEENSFDLDSLVSLKIESSDELTNIKRSLLEFDYKETDEFNDETISNFRNWIEKKLKDVVILSREKTFGFNLDDLKKPRTKEDLEILDKKQYFELYRNFITSNIEISSPSIPKSTLEEKAKFIGELLDFFSSKETFSSIPENQFNEIKEEYKDSLELLLKDDRNEIDNLADNLSTLFNSVINHSKYKSNIFDYTRNTYAEINSFLRGIDSLDPEGQDTVLNLIEAFFQENSTLKENIVVTRGTNRDTWLKEKLAGDYVIDEGIFSSSISLDVAKGYSDKHQMNGVIYVLFLPKGTRGMYVETISEFSHEKEFLISPGSVFKILSIENRKFSENKTLHKAYGLIYFLLHVGTITTKVLNKRFKGNPSWNALKERIAMK